MKVLTVWEPWATLLALGKKRVETRSWPTSYRGWIAIHAAKGGPSKQHMRELLNDAMFAGALGDTPLSPGCIVGVGKLIRCYPTSHLVFEDRSPQEDYFGNFDEGRYGWVIDNAFRLPDPIPFRGQQGLTDLHGKIAEQIQAQWRKARAESPLGAYL